MNPDHRPQSLIVASLDVSPVIEENNTAIIAVQNENSSGDGTNVRGATYQFFFKPTKRNTFHGSIPRETELKCTLE